MLDVFRFAWFAVRTFFGVGALLLALYAAMWVFVKIHSSAMGNVDPDAALRRVMSYNAQGIKQVRKTPVVPQSGTNNLRCGSTRHLRSSLSLVAECCACASAHRCGMCTKRWTAGTRSNFRKRLYSASYRPEGADRPCSSSGRGSVEAVVPRRLKCVARL